MILKKELRTIKKKGLEKIQPDTQKNIPSDVCYLNIAHPSNGETMEGWKCDSNGVALDKNTPNFRVKEVQEPISHDEDGEPDQWKIIGFETV